MSSPAPVRAAQTARAGRLSAALRWMRERPLGVHPGDALALVVMGVASLVMLATLSDYGLTYDEDPHVRYGERVLSFYADGFVGTKALRSSSYGAGFDLTAALLRRISPWDEFRTNHFLCLVVAELGLLGTWRLGRLLGGAWAGAGSLVLLLLVPVYYGHQFNNPKDIPFAAGYVWGLYFVARVILSLQTGQSPPVRFYFGLALSFALGLSVRIGGVLLLAFLAFFVVVTCLDCLRTAGRSAFRVAVGTGVRALAGAAGGWLLMIAFWPRALLSPIEGPAGALARVQNFTTYDSPTLLAGRVVSSNDLPWRYLPTYFALQIPELVSFLFVATQAGVCVVSVRCLHQKRALPWVWWLPLAATLAPPAYAVLRGSTVYNGLRHFLFVIPPLAVLAGAGFAGAVTWAAARSRKLALAALAVLAVHVVDLGLAEWRLHPYQHVYFNRMAGGVAGAVGRYETEYYGSVYQELLERLAEYVWRERRRDYYNSVFGVAGCGSKLFFTRNLPLNFAYYSMGQARRAHYYATYVRDRCLQRYRNREKLISLARDGAELGAVRDLKRRRRRGPGRDGGKP